MNIRRVVKDTIRGVGLGRWLPANPLQDHLRLTLPSLGVDCVFDVGANRGQFGEELRTIGYEGWIVSFEPNPEAAASVGEQAAQDPKWRVLPVALGETTGTQSLHVFQGSKLSSVLDLNAYAKKTFGTDARSVREDTVEMDRLDSVFDRLRGELGFRRPFLKMDTQGYDLHVLRGAEGCWEELVGLMTEVSLKPIYEGMPDITESLDAVREAGFDVTGLFPVCRDRRTGAVIEMDCVARRRERRPETTGS